MADGSWYKPLAWAARQAADFAVKNPGTCALCATTGVVVAAPMAVAGPGLAAVGFTANGVAAGSAAAGWQATIGNVVASSMFATLQSAAAGGYGVAAVSSATSLASGTVAATTGAIAAWRTWGGNRGEDNDVDAEDGKDANDQAETEDE